jgi:hypothetical protein
MPFTKAWTIADGGIPRKPVPAQDSKSLKNNRDFCVDAIPSWVITILSALVSLLSFRVRPRPHKPGLQ